MDDAIVSYIKEQLAAGQNVTQIMEAMQQHGYTKAQIDQYFKAIYQPQPTSTNISSPPPPPSVSPVSSVSTPVPSSSNMPAQPATPPSHSKHFDITKAFVVIGAILIILAVIVVVYSQWYSVGPIIKILFMVIPMLALYTIAAFLDKSEHYKEIGDVTLGLGSFILPFAIGTIICQTNIISEVNSLVVFLSAILALPVYLILEYIVKKTYMSIFTIIAIFVAYFALVFQYSANMNLILWLAFVLSMVILSIGFLLVHLRQERTAFYLVLGTIASLAFLPIATLYSLNEANSLELETNAIIISLFGLFDLVIAASYYYIYKVTENHNFYSLKRFVEEVSPLVILVPLLITGINNVGFSVVALILSIIFVLASTQVLVQSLLYIGSIGIIITIISISYNVFADSIGWPIILFIAGFAAIGIGLMIRKIYKTRKARGSLPVFMGLGVDVQESFQSQQKGSHTSSRTIIIIILVCMFGLPSLFGLFTMLKATSYQNSSKNIPNAQPENYDTDNSAKTIPEPIISPTITAKATVTPTANQNQQKTASGSVNVFVFDPNNNIDPRTTTNALEYNEIWIDTDPNSERGDDIISFYISSNTVIQVNSMVVAKSSINETEYNEKYKTATVEYSTSAAPLGGYIYVATNINLK